MKSAPILSRLALVVLLAALPASLLADEPAPGGEVRLPLLTYQSLVDLGLGESRPPRATLGRSRVTVQVAADGARRTARVQVDLAIQTFTAEGTLVPLLPFGSAIDAVTLDGAQATLAAVPDGLALFVPSAGAHAVSLGFTLDPVPTSGGFTLALPLPRTPGELTLTLPGAQLDATVFPASAVRMTEAGSATTIAASLPAAGSLQVTWRERTAAIPYALSRARYAGALEDGALRFSASFAVELYSAAPIHLPLFPATATVSEVLLDGRPAAVVVERDGDGQGDRLAAVVAGRGSHEVKVSFVVPVLRDDGPPHAVVAIPRVPLSRFELKLPGAKEVTVAPETAVTRRAAGAATAITFDVPMSDAVTLSWVEAIPEEARVAASVNAVIHNLVHAEEGILAVRAAVTVDVTRGEADRFEFALPEGVEVNRVTAASGGISDWRLAPAEAGKALRLTVLLDRRVKGEFRFDVFYEKLIGTPAPPKVAVPLAVATGVHRQSGMVALLASRDLGLEPVDEPREARVGENQLPPELREQVEATIAHTYKYTDRPPPLTVRPVKPMPKPAAFDAEVDTLVSVGDVGLKGSSVIAIQVKTGSVLALDLTLPAGTSVLALTGPSLRDYAVTAGPGETQAIHAEFTQEMEGRFDLALAYERLLGGGGEVELPAPSVTGAEVEHGRIAVEALAAVEIGTAAAERVSAVAIEDLPQQLVLRSTNPVLLAWQYARTDPPYRLALAVKRHRAVEVQAAVIDEAHFHTLVTEDGLAVTAARLTARNTRKQFLRLELPPGSAVWSATVAGKSEKPAAESSADSPATAPGGAPVPVLLKLVNSADPFVIEIVYATRIAPIGLFGQVTGTLPRPDLVVTHTRFEMFLPAGPRYGTPATNLDLVVNGAVVDRGEMQDGIARPAAASGLALEVPARGVRFSFEKLYASEGREAGYATIRYLSPAGAGTASALATLATLLLVGLAFARATGRKVRGSRAALAGSLLVLAASRLVLGAFPVPALVIAASGAALLALVHLRARGLTWPPRTAPVTGSDVG
jgi:hypothetical protein